MNFKKILFIFAEIIAAVILTCFMVFLLNILTSSIVIPVNDHNDLMNYVMNALTIFAGLKIVFDLQEQKDNEVKTKNLKESEFLLNFAQIFMNTERFFKVRMQLDNLYNVYLDRNNNPNIYKEVNENFIKDFTENKQNYIDFLVLFETIAPIINNGTVSLESIDNLLSYNFFSIFNEPYIQENEIIKYKNYYRGSIKLYEKLYNYKKEHNTLNDIMYVENGTLLDKLKKG